MIVFGVNCVCIQNTNLNIRCAKDDVCTIHGLPLELKWHIIKANTGSTVQTNVNGSFSLLDFELAKHVNSVLKLVYLSVKL